MTEPTLKSETSASSPQPRPLWMRLLGIRRRRHGRTLRFLRYKPTRWGWVLIFLVVGLLGMGAFAEYTMQPDFCRSCHIMEPYYQAWHSSTHKNVPCADCHFEPGLAKTLEGKWQASSQAVKYITGTYGSKPHAEIRDESCLRSGCHEKRILQGKVDWSATSHRGRKVKIKFDHAPHMQPDRLGKTLRCVSCHSQIVQGQHIVVTLDTCFLCHFKGKGLEHGRSEEKMLGAGCRACHDAPKGEIRLATGNFEHSKYGGGRVPCQNCHADTIRGDGAVPRQVCWNCHNNPTHVAKYDQTRLVHDNHVTRHKVECSSCHVQIEHHLTAAAPKEVATLEGKRPVFESGACGSCHTQTHAGPLDLYRGIGGRGVPDMPSPMFRTQVNCVACHKAPKRSSGDAAVVGQTFLGVEESCRSCHETKYDGMVAEWKKAVAVGLARAEPACARAKAALEKADLPPESRRQADILLADAVHNIRLVKLGYGVHNVNYAVALLNVAADNCRKIDALLSPPPATTAPRVGP